MAIDPNNSSIIYAGTEFSGILWKSTNAGVNWVRTGLGEMQGLLYALWIDYQNPGLIYGGSSWAPSGFLAPAPWHGIFKSYDGGINWQNFDEGLPDSSGVTKRAKQKLTGDLYISVSTIYGTSGIYERLAFGDSWTRIGPNVSIPAHSYTFCDLKISPDGRTLYYAGAGIFKLVLK